jgi:hypothetical protein
MALHHEGTQGTKGLQGTEAIQHGATNKLLFLWLLFFVSFVLFVPSFCS